ncbi:hypothetical protein NXS19_005017 [Fusarium pseudograminearum]|nr:hypothetical protein NXS19_005017 [Fusarium pseudograminearum]
MESQAPRDKNVHIDDSAALEQLGHKQELKRNFSKISLLGLAFAILNTWTALSASISLALPSGGPSSVIWGLMVAGICNLCLAAPLAEMLSAYPTAGGQYHWAALLAWPRWSRGISYVTGWINAAGYVVLTATAPLLGSVFVTDAITFMHPTYLRNQALASVSYLSRLYSDRIGHQRLCQPTTPTIQQSRFSLEYLWFYHYQHYSPGLCCT